MCDVLQDTGRSCISVGASAPELLEGLGEPAGYAHVLESGCFKVPSLLFSHGLLPHFTSVGCYQGFVDAVEIVACCSCSYYYPTPPFRMYERATVHLNRLRQHRKHPLVKKPSRARAAHTPQQ